MSSTQVANTPCQWLITLHKWTCMLVYTKSQKKLKKRFVYFLHKTRIREELVLLHKTTANMHNPTTSFTAFESYNVTCTGKKNGKSHVHGNRFNQREMIGKDIPYNFTKHDSLTFCTNPTVGK